jgi:hypothetical protein
MLRAAIASPVALGFVESRRGFAAIFLDDSQLLQIASEDAIRPHRILKALQIRFEFRCALSRQRINHPVLVAFDFDHSLIAKIAEMLGDLDLGFAEDGLEMTDAERRLRQQMRDAQSRPVAETLMDLNQVHPDLATGCGRDTASVNLHARDFLPLLRETLGLPFTEDHVEMLAGRFHFRDRILRHDAAVVFDFDLELIVRQDLPAELEDFREAVRFQPMINVLADVGLEQDGFALSRHSAAVDEVFQDVADFGDMGVGRNVIAIRQNKTRE